MIGRTTKTMADLGAKFQGKPTPDQLNQLQAIRRQQAACSNMSAPALLLAVIFMAISRYLG